jgi:hypothetical protein
MNPALSLLPCPRVVGLGDGFLSLPPQGGIALGVGVDANALRAGIDAVRAEAARQGSIWSLHSEVEPTLLAIRVGTAEFSRAEGYRLEIDRQGIVLAAHDAPGAFHGLMTLCQLLRQAGRSGLPVAAIDDWPDFPARGVMLDISRDKVPTLTTLFALVDRLAEWKINQFQLYTEHTFAYRAHERVWENASPMTAADIRALDAYCRERFVELVPNQNSFGHFNRWLAHDEYRHLAEAPDGATYWGSHRAPATLCPSDPGSLALVRELHAELLPNFTSRLVNVGCDETMELGMGRSKEEAERRGKEIVYLDFLRKIHASVAANGSTMMFWGDIILHRPELIPDLPRPIIALSWGYEANHPFAAEGAKFAAAGIPFYVCPGTSAWNSIGGRTENMKLNLLRAAENGLAHGAIGFLNTDWGDCGHWQQFPVSLPGYAYGAAVSWSVTANRDLDLAAALDLHAFGDAHGRCGRAAVALGDLEQFTLAPRRSNGTILHRVLLCPDIEVKDGKLENLMDLKGVEAATAHVAEQQVLLRKARPTELGGRRVADELACTVAHLNLALAVAEEKLQADRSVLAELPAASRRRIARKLAAFLPEYRRLWLLRNRPGGLRESLGHFHRLQGT